MWLRTIFFLHWPAVVLALLVTILIVWPPFVAKFQYGVPFDFPSNIRIDDEALYFGRIREVVDGYLTIGNAYLWEHKSKPPSPVFLGEFLTALPLRFTGIGVVAAGVVYDVVLPLVFVIMTYTCLWRVSRSRGISLIGAAYLAFGISLTDLARAVSPQFNFVFWLSLFLLLYKIITTEDGKRTYSLSVLAAINFGALFYLYTYYWTFYFLVFAFLAVFLSLQNRKLSARVFAIAGGGLLLAVPYFYFFIESIRLPEYSESLRRIGMIDSHFPSGIAVVIPAAVLLGVIVILLQQKVLFWNRETIFFVSGILAAVVSMNQHIITGKNLEFSSHYYSLSIFWFVFTLAWLARVGFGHFSRETTRSASAVLAIVLVIFIVGSRISLQSDAPLKRAALNRYTPLFEWINAHTSKDEVFVAPAAVSGLLPIYTPANVYFSSLARLSFVMDEELLHRFVINSYFEPFDQRSAEAHVVYIFGVGHINEALHIRQENRVRGLLRIPLRDVPDKTAVLADRIMRKREELARSEFEAGLKKYRADYMIWDTVHSARMPYDTLSFLEFLAEINEFRIYRVR